MIQISRHTLYMREWRRKNPRKSRAINAKARKKLLSANPGYQQQLKRKYIEKTRAQRALYKAVRRGTLNRPSKCQKCRKKCKPHGHHWNYERRFDVRWLCSACHGIEHRLEAGQ